MQGVIKNRFKIATAVVCNVLSLLALSLLTACGGGGGDDGDFKTPMAAAPTLTPLANESARIMAALPANTKCPDANNITLVYAGHECLVIRTFGSVKAGVASKLVVFLHGDVSSGGSADYMDLYAPAYTSATVASVRMLRPGYYDNTGMASTGILPSRADTYTESNVRAVVNALAALKVYYQAKRLVVVGHSGGAAISAIALGKHAGVIDDTVLLACPCDLRAWMPTWTNSLSPLEWAGSVTYGTTVRAITGSADVSAPPFAVTGYVSALAQRGIDATYTELAGLTHASMGLMNAPQVQEQIRALLH